MSKLTHGTITPAYGRDYTSIKAVQADFDAGKDFVYQSFDGSGYVGKADFEVGARIQARYGKLRKVGMVTVKAEQKVTKPENTIHVPGMTIAYVLHELRSDDDVFGRRSQCGRCGRLDVITSVCPCGGDK